VRGEDTLARRRGGWGVNILEDVRHSSVLYVCKYFVEMESLDGTGGAGDNEEGLAYGLLPKVLDFFFGNHKHLTKVIDFWFAV
jgi:hypothetical protein